MSRPGRIFLLPSVVTALALAAACGPARDDSGATSSPTPAPSASTTASTTPTATPVPTATGPTVGDYVSSTQCSTGVVRPLSVQLITELDCIKPGAVSEMPADNQIDVGSIFDYLQTTPGNTLPHVVNERAGVTMHVNSALRSLAQQYLLYQWYETGRCGITLAATPGTSNHERGLAMDIQDHTGWMTPMQDYQWHWLGSSDPVHFDYQGGGTTDIQGTSVLAFQRLWNLNHPDDPIAEDGSYGPQTASRLKKSPANGFPLASTCGAAPFASMEMLDGDLAPDTCAM